MGVNTVNAQQVTINVNDSLVPDNVATIDKDSKIGNAVSKEQFKKEFDAKSLDLDKKIEDIQNQVKTDFKGTLKPSSPAPIEDGSYRPEISSELDKPTDSNSTADWGEKYPNAGNLRAKAGYDTMFYKKGTVWTKSEVKIPKADLANTTEFQAKTPSKSFSPKQLFDEVIGDFDFALDKKINNKLKEVSANVDKANTSLKSFVAPKYNLDYTFNIANTGNYNIYGVSNQFNRRLKSDNTGEAKTGSGQYYNIWRNISTTQGTKKIGKIILKVTPYTNISSETLKNATLLGIKNGVVIPLVVGTGETVPNALQTFEINVEEYDSFSIGLYAFDANPVTATQTIEFYMVDRTVEEDGVLKYINSKIGGSGGSKPGFIDLIDFGCAGDGVTDDTDKINAAVVQLINDGGGFIYGRDRKFKVSSINIPDVKKWCRIGIIGSIAPAPRFGTVGDFDVKTYNGMEIISNLNDTSKGIINVSAGSGFGGFNLAILDVQKVTVRSYNNPQCHGINATNAAQLYVENVLVDTGVYNVQASLPTAITAGILTPKLSNGAKTVLNNVVVCGYHAGIYVYEHTNGDNIDLASNKIGLRFYKANHASLFGRVGFYRNQKDIVVEDFHRFEILQMAVELVGAGQSDANNEWQKSIYNLEDIGNKGSGKISYDVCLGGVGPVETFTKNGGNGVLCTKL